MPCFEGLLPAEHELTTMDLLFVNAYWHALAKMRMHTDTSLTRLRDATTVLGYELRRFAHVTCPAFATRETQAEYDACKRAEERRAKKSGTHPSSIGGHRARTFNMKTIKLHFLGDYVSCIKQNGTTDSYTTQTVRGI